ncbi:NUDIX domain-containing protein [Actinomycetospora corticicola]|uniref:ADP-ribose pyrophosphatase YjhB (NUDIX family) n=1 Tax=Actinomycetospora corticicola TaxID=663602 RepID=A0A7Y9J982_9PSEU|nr:ADP-ribose pyrophosphatase YjhB (NUDIX family) [Actinomycetospora corticicola]
MSDTPLHSVSVAGVTFDDSGRVLLIRRRDNGEWQAPGGVLELGESLEVGVVREVLEETMVQVQPERITGIYKNLARGIVAIVFRCRPIAGIATPTDESVEVAWFSLAEVVELLNPVFAVRVTDAARYSTYGVQSRSHDGVKILPSRY